MSFKMITLGEYAKIQGGFAYKSKDFIEVSEYRVLKIKNVRFGIIDYSEPAFVPKSIAESTSNWRLKEGDILISMTGSGPNAPQSLVGRVARVWKNEPDAWFNQRVGRVNLVDNRKIHPDFLFYWLSLPHNQSFLVANSSGSANQANISGKTIESLPTPLVDYEISSAIAKIARELDEKIILNTQTNQTLESIAQSIFQSWFVNFDPVKAKIEAFAADGSPDDAELAAMCVISAKTIDELNDLKASNPEAFDKLAQTAALFPSAMQDSELGKIPEGWRVLNVEESFKVVMGQSPRGDTYNDTGEGTLFYQGRAEFGWRFPTPRLYTTDPNRMASKGDVLMSVRAPVGDLNIAMNDCCVGRGLCSLLHNSSSTSFTYYLLKSLQSKLNSFNGEGTVFGSIKQKDLKAIRYVSASKSIIKSFIELIGDNDRKIEVLSSESLSLTALRDSLLPKLLTGKV